MSEVKSKAQVLLEKLAPFLEKDSQEEKDLATKSSQLVKALKSKSAKKIDLDDAELKRDDGFSIVSWEDKDGGKHQVSFWRDKELQPYELLTHTGNSGKGYETDKNFKDFKSLEKEALKFI